MADEHLFLCSISFQFCELVFLKLLCYVVFKIKNFKIADPRWWMTNPIYVDIAVYASTCGDLNIGNVGNNLTDAINCE